MSTRKDEVMTGLIAGIERLTTSGRWQEYLKVQSKFHRYSFNNTLLICLQRPDATRVAGFHAWRKLGRNVRKGEKAIWILAPVTQRVELQVRSEDDELETVARRSPVAFKPTCVFDISQTDGVELPQVCTRLAGEDVTGVYGRLVAVARSLGYTVEEDHLTGEVNGDCNFEKRRIRVEVRNDQVQQVKTLAHELAHAMLHENFTDRSLAELEAESVAYIVCDALDINSGDYTFGYVAGWAGGGDEAVSRIKAAGSRIQHTADDILSRLEAASAVSDAAA
ncbi:MAG TPA: ArdC-like ssDNA-binding domain-containing protein [Acidimicrobiales bacterium]|nr:ArdC-like ssDNA-binding domain-containing protein [Acidimicrobiales bacterium]